MAMVLDGRSALTRGLMVVSTASALTVAILAPHLRDSLALRIEETSTLQRRRRRRGRGRSAEAAKGTAAGQAAHLGNETEPVPVEVLVGRVKDGVEEEEEAEGNTDGRDPARARLGGGVGSRRGLLRCAAVWVCDGGGGWVPAATVVYEAGPGAPGHLLVCVAYGHLALSKLNNYLPVSASVCQDHMPLFT